MRKGNVFWCGGLPGRIRTCDLTLRRGTLFLSELRAERGKGWFARFELAYADPQSAAYATRPKPPLRKEKGMRQFVTCRTQSTLRHELQPARPDIAQARLFTRSVIGHLVVLLAIRPDLVRALARTDLFLSVGGVLGVGQCGKVGSDTGFELRAGVALIVDLGAFGFGFGLNPGGPMAHHDGGLPLVAVLAASAGAFGDDHLDVAFVDLPQTLWAYFEDGDGDGGGVCSSSALGRRNALPPVAAGLGEKQIQGVRGPVNAEVKGSPVPRG